MVDRTGFVVLAAALTLSACATSKLVQVPDVTNARTPADGIVSAGRIDAEDMGKLQSAGIRHVIDLSVDAETPDFDEAAAVRGSGMTYENLPIRGPSDLTKDNVAAFDRLLKEARHPVLIHCGSGNRVGAMAALRAAWIEGKSVEDAVAIGKSFGLTMLEPAVRERLGAEAK